MERTQKFIITKWKQGILSLLLEDNKDLEIHYDELSDVQVGNIYIAKVKDVVKNINAAFVEIIPGTKCYLSLENTIQPIYLNRLNQNAKAKLVQGDEILVQVVKEQVKTKDAVVTTELSFAGQYVVLSSGSGLIRVSSKLTEEQRAHLRTELKAYIPKDINVIIRTNSQYAKTDEIIQELTDLNDQRNRLIETAKHRTCYCVMWQPPKKYMTLIRDLKQEVLCEIVTDDEELYQELLSYKQSKIDQNHDLQIKYYKDKLLPLIKHYSIETRLEKALCKRVWLKSGGYLVIEPTEALTSIDVNTGKYDGKKNLQDTFLKINLEAAAETVRQLRLRNLSGIIIVDFINMERKEDRDLLLENLRELVKNDRVKTQVHDMTALQLVEITRKKMDRPLYEKLSNKTDLIYTDIK
ncbi:MAG: ribonuclease E/G [Clostridia bacterium]|nr:ribonuclease E/G [Clostridia bacterium]